MAIVTNRGIRSTTIVQSANPATGQPGRILSAAMTSSSTTRITPEDVKDPSRLTKALNDIQQSQDAQTQASRSNPFSSPCIIRDLSFGAGETKVIPHTLGRNFTDWHTSRPRGASPSGLLEVTLPSASHQGVTPDKAIVIQNTGSALTVNLVIVGD